ncbi:MAG: hypothetical protein AB1679_12735 [Actinomycetota bacterium]
MSSTSRAPPPTRRHRRQRQRRTSPISSPGSGPAGSGQSLRRAFDGQLLDQERLRHLVELGAGQEVLPGLERLIATATSLAIEVVGNHMAGRPDLPDTAVKDGRVSQDEVDEILGQLAYGERPASGGR